MKLIPMLLLILTLLQTIHPAHAETIRLEKSLHPAPTTLSGTLVPFALAINGEPIVLESQSVVNVSLNGKELPLQDEVSRSFYVLTDEDEILLTGKAADGSIAQIFSSILPKIRSIEIEGGKALFKMEGDLKKFSLDGKDYSTDGASSKSGELPIPAEHDWIERPHVLEITDAFGFSRIYNLNFSEWKSQELRSWTIGLANIGPSGPMSGTGYGIYVWRSWENRLVMNTSLSFINNSRTDTLGSSITESKTTAYGINVRVGKYPFLPGQGIFDLRRLIVGPFVGWVRATEKHINTPSGGGPAQETEDTESYGLAGFFVHETLIRYQGFGMSVHFDFGFLSSRPGNVRAGFELSYTW